MGRVTIDDVARRARVSVATVSRALRGLPNVSPHTRERVLAAARELDYRPDPNASRLAAGKTHTVAMAVPSPSLWYSGQVVAGAEAVLSASGYDLMLFVVADEASRRRLLAGPDRLGKRVDGLIMVDCAPEEPTDFPLVTVGAEVEGHPCAVIDNRAAGAMAAQHLLELGHREIGLIGGDPDVDPSTTQGLRRTGFLDALAEGGVSVPAQWDLDGGFSVVGGYEAMAEMLAGPRRPTAVFAMSDDMAFGALRAAAEVAVTVPGELSVIGFDDHAIAFTVGLSTVRQDPEALGAAGAHLLVDLLADPHAPPRRIEEPTELVPRESTGPRPRKMTLELAEGGGGDGSRVEGV